ncbi:MAG: hypothetical protein Q9187_008179 [Circinaria calcarea]
MCKISASVAKKTDMLIYYYSATNPYHAFYPGIHAPTAPGLCAGETLSGLNHLLTLRNEPSIQELAQHSTLGALPPLDHTRCLNYTQDALGLGRRGTIVKVVKQDTLDAAQSLLRKWDSSPRGRLPPRGDNVLLPNMANGKSPGGGWEQGRMVQEEELCYRSSISLTFDEDYYASRGLPNDGGDFAPSVVIIREAAARGHSYYDFTKPLNSVAVVSVAAERDPRLSQPSSLPCPHYADPMARESMKAKWRLILQLSALKGHRRLVLGMLGCGVLKNPPQDVVDCFKEVMRENQFRGGWWEEIIFAVLEKQALDQGNFDIAYRELHGRYFG